MRIENFQAQESFNFIIDQNEVAKDRKDYGKLDQT